MKKIGDRSDGASSQLGMCLQCEEGTLDFVYSLTTYLSQPGYYVLLTKLKSYSVHYEYVIKLVFYS